MFSPIMSTSWFLLPSIMVNSTPVFSPSSTFMCGFWINFQGSQEIRARVQYLKIELVRCSVSSSKHLNALARTIFGLTRSFFGRCDLLYCLKILLKKGSSSQLLLDRFCEDNDEKTSLMLTMMVPSPYSLPSIIIGLALSLKT